MKIIKVIVFFIITTFHSILFANFTNSINLENVINLNNDIKKEIKIENIEYIADKIINVFIDIPDGYYAYRKSKIANIINIVAAGENRLKFKAQYSDGIKYKNDVIIKGKQLIALKLDKKIESRDYDIILSYQLCNEDNNICLAPENKIISFTVDNNKNITVKSVEDVPSSSSIIADNNSIVSNIQNNTNILLTVMLIFLAGIASVLLPCTYPLISITISLIGIEKKDGSRDNKQSILSSALFSLGIITTYTLLGAVVAFAGNVFHKNILFGSIGYNPIVLTFIVILFLYFTFSMAGFYDIKIPSVLNKIKNDTYNKNRNSVLYKYIIGLITGIIATPCAAPVIALILEIAFLNPAYALLYMAVYALGFSIVLFVLSISLSTLINKLPKAGSWMNYIRLLFSFVMLIVSYYYLQILIKNIGLVKIAPMIAGLIIFIVGFLIFIILNKQEKILLTLKELKIFFTLMVVGIIIASTFTTIKDISVNKETISLKDAIVMAEKTNKKVLIDFSAVWCENCYLLEKNVLNSAIMKNYLENNNYILVKIDVDKNKDIAKEFSVKWLPWLIVIDSNKNILYTKNSFESFNDKMTMLIISELEGIK